MRTAVNYTFIILIAFLLLNNQEAEAYINPGSGSYIFQTVIGGVLSIFYLCKKLVLKIIHLFIKNKHE